MKLVPLHAAQEQPRSKALIVNIPAGYLQTRLGTKFRRQKEVIHMDHSGTESGLKLGGQSRFSRRGPTINGQNQRPL